MPSAATAGAPSRESELPGPTPQRITLLCRRGNDSLLAARAVRRYLSERGDADVEVEVEDVRGGIAAWALEEPGFPVY